MDVDVFIDGVSEMCNVNSIEVKHIATDSVKIDNYDLWKEHEMLILMLPISLTLSPYCKLQNASSLHKIYTSFFSVFTALSSADLSSLHPGVVVLF